MFCHIGTLIAGGKKFYPICDVYYEWHLSHDRALGFQRSTVTAMVFNESCRWLQRHQMGNAEMFPSGSLSGRHVHEF